MSVNYNRRSETIEFDGGDVTVRGLRVSDLSILVDTHRETATALFDRFTGRDPNTITTGDVGDLAMALLTTVPTIVAHVIAVAADANDRIQDVLDLPMDVQVAALEKVANLTFAMQGGLSGFLETIARLGQTAEKTVVEVKAKRLQR